MIYIFSFIIVLGIPVLLHELGHFLAGRSVGIKINKFSVGFPPRLFSFTSVKKGWNLRVFFWKKNFNKNINKKYVWAPIFKKFIKTGSRKGSLTEYCLALVPLGGYVKAAGIFDESLDTSSKAKNYEFRSKNVFQKIWFLSAGVLMNFVLATVVFSCTVFFNGYHEIIDEPIISQVYNNISEDENKLSPARKIGLLSNDKILSINNIKINSFTELKNILKENPEKEIPIKWERYGIIYNSKITPDKITTFSKGEMVEIGIIGIAPNYNIKEAGLIKSIIKGIDETISWIILMSFSIWSLLTGNVSMDQLAGPLGIAKIAGIAAQSGGLESLIRLMALISINLGIINILPLPVVDGGHVVIAIIEGIYGKELPLKLKSFIQLFGMILLLVLFIFIFMNDIKNF